MEIKIERAKTLKEKPNQDNLGFGNYFTDHMFMMDNQKEQDGMMHASFHTHQFQWILLQWYFTMPKRLSKV